MRSRYSYRAPARPAPSRAPRYRVVVPLALAAVALLLFGFTRSLERASRSLYPVSRPQPFDPERTPPGTPPTDLAREPGLPISLRPGETLAGVLEGLGVQGADAVELTSELGRYTDLRKLRPEDTLHAKLGRDEALDGLSLTLAGRGRVEVVRRGGDWQGAWRPFERSVRLRVVRGELDEALETAVRGAGAASLLAYRMSEVLQWDLDFNRDLRRGDRFAVLYERVYLDGNFDSLGTVLALHYTNRGHTFEAYRFGEPAGYYDGEGRPMRKLFLRSPLRFSRVTSNFSHRRFHPVLKTYRPHYGVDYGAPTGTPVRVTANGVVTFAGWDKGGGRTVKVRHTNGYLTAYLHLSRFASGVRPGRRVGQGEVVGYVGATGLATASHLDYRVQHNGRWVNPLSLKSVPTAPLADDQMPAFERWRDQLRSSLDSGRPPAVKPSPPRVAAGSGRPSRAAGP